MTPTQYQRLFDRINKIECWHRRNGRPEFGSECWHRWQDWVRRCEVLNQIR